jgi:WD40 repeat protein
MVVDLAVRADGKTLAVLLWKEFSGVHELRLLDVTTGRGKVLHKAPRHSYLSLLFAPDGKLLLLEFRRATVLALSPDGKWLAAGRADGAVQFWDLAPNWRRGGRRQR